MNIKLTNDHQKLYQTLRLQLRTAYIHAVTAVKGVNSHDVTDLAFTDTIEARLEDLFREAKKVLPEGEGTADTKPVVNSRAPVVYPGPPSVSSARASLPPQAPLSTALDSVEDGMKSLTAVRA